MTEKQFFDDWPGRIITFTTPTYSAWRLEKNLSDKNDQIDADDYHLDAVRRGKPGGAYGIFECRNIKTNEIGVVKIVIQVPYRGSEYVSARERRKQASQVLTRHAKIDIKPLLVLTVNKCTAAPRVKAYQREVQGKDGMVPGGFLLYVLMEKAPGQQLSYDLFWGFNRVIRDQIRDAFRVAWEECLRAGMKPCPWGLRHLFWSPDTQKIVIAGFRYASSTGPDDHWTDRNWIAWKLARSPINFDRATLKESHLDKPTWTL